MVEGGQRQLVAELTGHDGPVWQVCWAHPRYGNILASCSYDRQVFVWKEFSPNQWGQIYAYQALEGSVNAIAWSPHEFGLCLACASSDETVAVLSWQADDVWEGERVKAWTWAAWPDRPLPAACRRLRPWRRSRPWR